ncbi:hypothetical protein B0T14DRAFT_594288 [Immersiella caudata]|uniref:Nephrocystin 3-like N-terminal domain-containing protein n=1 Tax=Immersiella caudata TaxID=314043 RepID=A0AA39THF4_9PEZI|nr:hypothetical protein B0T14DRAFT_594288 [Immersiella caudata]
MNIFGTSRKVRSPSEGASQDAGSRMPYAATSAIQPTVTPRPASPGPAADAFWSANGLLDGPVLPPPSPDEEKFLRSLNSSYQHHRGQVDGPVPGTCEWIASREVWKRWDSFLGPALLWVTAAAGGGKSVLAKFLLGHLEAKRPLSSGQLPLLQHIPRGATRNLGSLWEALKAVLKEVNAKEVTWVLDGLDECEPASLHELLRKMSEYLDDSLRGASRSEPSRTRFKMILLSRPQNTIQQAIALVNFAPQRFLPNQNRFQLALEKQADNVVKDMAGFIRFKISELKQSPSTSELLSPDMFAWLESKLMSNPNQTFLSVSLIISHIQYTEADEISTPLLESILTFTCLDDLYESILECRTLPLKGRKALMLVLAAVRPLTLKEMCAAVEVHQDHFIKEEGSVAEELVTKHKDEFPFQFGERLQIQDQSSQMGSLIQQGLARAGGSQQSWLRHNPRSEEYSATPAEIATSSSVRTLDQLGQLLHKPFFNHLHQICGPLLKVRGSQIYIAHQTAREFLLARPGMLDSDAVNAWIPLGPSKTTTRQLTETNPRWHHSIRLEDANRLFLQTCASYIRLFHSDPMHNQDPTQWTSRSVTSYLKSIRNDPPRALFKYAAFHWLDHYRPVRRELEFSFDYLLNPNSPYFNHWVFVHRSWTMVENKNKSEEVKGIPIGGSNRRNDGREWKSDAEFSMSLKIGNLDDMDQNRWLTGWQKGNGWMDATETEKFERVLDHFGFSSGYEMELFDEEFMKGEEWWKTGDEQDGDEEGVEMIPDRVKFLRRRRRALVMERLGELSDPLSQQGSIPSWHEIGSFFTTMGSFQGGQSVYRGAQSGESRV